MPKTKQTLPAFTPVPRLKPRSNGWSDEIQLAFIEALAETGSVEAACRRVNRSSNGAYQLRRHKEAKSFRKAWEAALDLGIQRIEDVAMDRALNGIEVPVYSYGKLVGTRRVYNDKLIMFLLRNRSPKRFAGNKAGALSALDRSTLTRLEKEWRKKWEREQGALQLQRESETIASINAKIDRMREKEEAAKRLEEKYRARSPAQPDEDEAAQREWDEYVASIQPSPEMQKLLPGYVEPGEETEEPKGPRIRTIKGNWD